MKLILIIPSISRGLLTGLVVVPVVLIVKKDNLCTEYGKVWLIRLVWDQENEGSNPSTPITER